MSNGNCCFQMGLGNPAQLIKTGSVDALLEPHVFDNLGSFFFYSSFSLSLGTTLLAIGSRERRYTAIARKSASGMC